MVSAFNGGEGKRPYQHHFGDEFTSVKDTGIFIWDKDKGEIQQLKLPKGILPSYVCFGNMEGSEVIFGAYTRQHWNHGINFFYNRPSHIYRARVDQA